MSIGKPTNIEMIKRILAELAKYDSPEELVRQLNLNTTLEQRNTELETLNGSLTRTRDNILERIKEFLAQEAEALKRRDGVYEQIKTAKEEHAKLQEAIASSRETLAGAIWVRSILQKDRPSLLESEKHYLINFLEQKRSEPYDWTGESIIDLIIDELKNRGTLIPKRQYSIMQALARQWADTIRGVHEACQRFVRAPQKMTTEQRRALLIGAVEAGADTKEKFDELLKKASELAAQCPIHRAKLAWNEKQLKWICPTPNCQFTF